MKYGLLVYQGEHGGTIHRTTPSKFNVGDNIQMLAMERIYTQEMNIPIEEIVRIDFHNLSSFDGEYVILPVNLFFFGCGYKNRNWFPASSKIVPVFIGVHFATDSFTDEQIEYLRYYAPIGCRDAFTLHTMQKYHIPAYLFGCITATLPKRETKPERNIIYFVDVPKEVYPYIPKHNVADRVERYHEIEAYFSQETFSLMEKYACDLLTEYKENASLIVTSRLHCASPCVAMGIPTILTVKQRSSRFAWIEKYLPIYTPDCYSDIDWAPSAPHYEMFKRRLINIVVSRLESAMKQWSLYYDVSRIYENSVVGNYIDPLDNLKRVLTSSVFLTGNERYIIWGLSCHADPIFNYIVENWPNAKLVAVVDEYTHTVFHNLHTITSEELIHYIDVPIIVAASGASNYVHQKACENSGYGKIIYLNGKIETCD